MDHVFVDAKLIPGNSHKATQIISVAMIRTSETGHAKRGHQEILREGVDFRDAYSGFVRTIADVAEDPKVLVVVTDSSMRFALRDACHKATLPELFEGRAWIDAMQVAWPLQAAGIVPNRLISTLATYYGIALERGNDTAANAMNLMRVYFAMMPRLKTAVMGENTLADVGGQPFKSIRSMMGF